jgi:phosphatidylglycerophosphate synthase
MAKEERDMTKYFPIIRHMSKPISRVLIKLPVTPNQITSMGLIFGLAGCIFFLSPEVKMKVIGSLLFVIAYILDNCDGEVARHKNLASTFGHSYDTFSDWIINTGIFAALGFGISAETGNNLWLGLGLVSSLGSTINYMISLFLNKPSNNKEKLEEKSQPKNFKEYLIFVFRELFRADFCFIVLGLSIIDQMWILLPAGAIGSQVYWLMFFLVKDKNYHV